MLQKRLYIALQFLNSFALKLLFHYRNAQKKYCYFPIPSRAILQCRWVKTARYSNYRPVKI